MRYYAIEHNGLFISYSKEGLERFYDNVKPLPDDYEEGKYIRSGDELVLNPDWEEEQQEKQKQHEIDEIKSKLTELDSKRIRAICENEIKDETTGETWLEYYNSRVIELRKQLDNL